MYLYVVENIEWERTDGLEGGRHPFNAAMVYADDASSIKHLLEAKYKPYTPRSYNVTTVYDECVVVMA